MTLAATYYGANSWLIEFDQLNILVDPWFNGSLVFPPGPWLIEGILDHEINIPSKIDLILLTQGLADHCHPPTLQKLSKVIPVVGSISASKIATRIGFENVQALKPGLSVLMDNLKIEATAGASVPGIENGYLVSSANASLYIEPHGFLDSEVLPRKLDAVITPVVNLKLPLFGAFVKGKDVLPSIIQRFQPLTILASTVGGDATFKGVVGRFITVEGSSGQVEPGLSTDISFLDPQPEKRYVLPTHA